MVEIAKAMEKIVAELEDSGGDGEDGGGGRRIGVEFRCTKLECGVQVDENFSSTGFPYARLIHRNSKPSPCS